MKCRGLIAHSPPSNKKIKKYNFESVYRFCSHILYSSTLYTVVVCSFCFGSWPQTKLWHHKITLFVFCTNDRIYSSICFQVFDHGLLFHMNALDSEYPGCGVWTFQTSVQCPSGILCETPELLRCHEIWSTSRDYTPHHLHSTLQEDRPDILLRQTALDRKRNVWRLFTIISYNWCIFLTGLNIYISAMLGGGFAFGNWNIDILI